MAKRKKRNRNREVLQKIYNNNNLETAKNQNGDLTSEISITVDRSGEPNPDLTDDLNRTNVTTPINESQQQMDELNKRATVDPNLTAEEYQKQMENINNNTESPKINMDDFVTADDMTDSGNNFDFSDQADPGTEPNPTPKREPSITRDYKGDNYSFTLEDLSNPTNILYNNEEIEYINGKPFNKTKNAFLDDKETESLTNILLTNRNNNIADLTEEEMNTILKNPSKFGYDYRDNELKNSVDFAAERKDVFDKKALDIQQQIDELKNTKVKGKKNKKELNSKIEELTEQMNGFKSKSIDSSTLLNKQQVRMNSIEQRKEFRKQFKEKIADVEIGSAEYKEARKTLASQNKIIRNEAEVIMDKQAKVAEGLKKGLGGKKLTVGSAINIGFSAKAAIDQYKESRAEGKSAISSGIRAGASAMAAEIAGPVAQVGLMAAQIVPSAVVSGADMLYREHRRMNSASSFVPLGGASFQDSQDLATMRQSGMELAKMSQYNLEQTLMGAEAKHLHR